MIRRVATGEDGLPTLAAIRAAIDAIDRDLVDLLAERARLVEQVVGIKKREHLPANIPGRVEAVIAAVRARAAEAGLEPDLAERVWREMIAGFVALEEKALRED
jgi:isochorismate pyruvate lyase